jgi:hypothetical protein
MTDCVEPQPSTSAQTDPDDSDDCCNDIIYSDHNDNTDYDN